MFTKWLKPLKKGAIEGATVAASLTALLAAMGIDLSEKEVLCIIGIPSLVSSVVRAVRNRWKHRRS